MGTPRILSEVRRIEALWSKHSAAYKRHTFQDDINQKNSEAARLFAEKQIKKELNAPFTKQDLYRKYRTAQERANIVRKYLERLKKFALHNLTLPNNTNTNISTTNRAYLKHILSLLSPLTAETIDDLLVAACYREPPRPEVVTHIRRTWRQGASGPYQSEERTAVKVEKGQPFPSAPLPLTPTPKLIYEGRAQRKVGSRPQTFNQTLHLPDVVWPDYRVPQNEIHVGGSFDTCRSTVQSFGERRIVGGTQRLITGTLKLSAHKLHLPSLPLPSLTTLPPAMKLNPRAGSGLFSQPLAQKKAQLVPHLRGLVELLLPQITSTPSHTSIPQSIGCRGKPNNKKFGEELKSRAIFMSEGALTAIESIIAGPAVDAFVQQRGTHSIGLGFSPHGSRYYDIVGRFRDYIAVHGFDYQRFDSTAPRKLIVAAFGIIRAMFPDSEELDNLLLWCMGGFIYRRIITPGGHQYQMTSGIPSGSAFTTLVGSLVNFLATHTTLHSFSPKLSESCDGIFYGDDSLFANPNEHVGPTDSEYQKAIFFLWGLEIPDQDLFTGPLMNPDEDLCIPFLGMRFWGTLPSRSTEDYARMTLAPAKKKYITEAGQYLRMQYLSHAAWDAPRQREYLTRVFEGVLHDKIGTVRSLMDYYSQLAFHWYNAPRTRVPPLSFEWEFLQKVVAIPEITRNQQISNACVRARSALYSKFDHRRYSHPLSHLPPTRINTEYYKLAQLYYTNTAACHPIISLRI